MTVLKDGDILDPQLVEPAGSFESTHVSLRDVEVLHLPTHGIDELPVEAIEVRAEEAGLVPPRARADFDDDLASVGAGARIPFGRYSLDGMGAVPLKRAGLQPERGDVRVLFTLTASI